MRTLAKTGTYWFCHISVASTLAFILTRQLNAALALGLLEPSIQALVYLLHERLWEARLSGAMPAHVQP